MKLRNRLLSKPLPNLSGEVFNEDGRGEVLNSREINNIESNISNLSPKIELNFEKNTKIKKKI